MKTKIIISFISLISSYMLSYAQLYDSFLPKNEYYTYNSDLGLVTSFAGGKSTDNTGAIHISGKIWSSGRLSSDVKYNFKWADSCYEYKQGVGITGGETDYGVSYWTNPANALGKPSSSDTSDVVVLGDGGSITMSFGENTVIRNGDGYDFVVFENALNDYALEFAYVSVSSDGKNFISLPNFYLGTSPVGGDSDGGNNNPSDVYNLGSKYSVGNGNGYDLNEIILAYDYALDHYDSISDTVLDNSVFSYEYTKHLLDMFGVVDLDAIKYVKIDDIVGDGSSKDSSGNAIYDSYPTSGTPGFDLSGIGAINTAEIPEPSSYSIVFALLSLLLCLKRKKFL